ncbi:phage holin family protein [Streptomyces aidingensis]|uniref:Putative Holin-X, holin superfamily III n=1 Tax=Streptomyces aidingensis TaxID=910347 RepID=A0A1I1EWE3_9ACTN|nr:phage holin family protein [Streptomyces aidingensis]SFB91499.1 Putative Holin-X, holin superfamily III [Streptomyces aidingensis]
MATVHQESPTEHRRAGRPEDASVGELLSAVATDAQLLFRQEVQLAKAEIRQEARSAGTAAGMFGGAGFGGCMVALFLSLALLFGLANVMDAGWAALIVAVLWAVIAAVLFAMGRSRMRSVSPKPQQTMESLKEDAQWARHPTK